MKLINLPHKLKAYLGLVISILTLHLSAQDSGRPSSQFTYNANCAPESNGKYEVEYIPNKWFAPGYGETPCNPSDYDVYYEVDMNELAGAYSGGAFFKSWLIKNENYDSMFHFTSESIKSNISLLKNIKKDIDEKLV